MELSNTFQFQAIDGRLTVGSKFNRARFLERLKKGGRGHIIFETPESRGQRSFFEGAVVALATYFQDHLDYRDWRQRDIMRDELIREFIGVETYTINSKRGQAKREVLKSSKGSKVLNELLEKAIDWLVEEYAIDPAEVLNPDKYKDWRDRIRVRDERFDTYIDYLIFTRKLKRKYNE